MKKFTSILLVLLILFPLTACLKRSKDPCTECGSKDAYLYKIERIGKETLEEKITVSYCKHCYNVYLEETFGYGVKAKAEEEDAKFKDVIGAGGYLDELQ